MNNYRAILKRVGFVLIVAGILDLVYLFQVRPAPGHSYSSSFSLLVVVGVLLWRGNLRVVPFISWAAAFLLSYLIGSLLILLPSKPAELWAIEFRLDPVSLSLSLLYQIAVIALIFWVYTQLRTAPVVSAIVQSGDSATPPKSAFILGIGLVAILAAITQWTFNGEAGAKALQLALTQYGQAYKYQVTGLRWEGGQVKASLIAYNEQEIKPVQVEWKQ